jgi:hypothetical protein
MNAIRTACLALLPALMLAACSVEPPKPQNTVLAPEQQQLGKRRIYTSATLRTPQEAARNFISRGNGAVPVILFKGENAYVEHVFDLQPDMDTCMTLLTERANKSRLEGAAEFRSYYCVPLEDGITGAAAKIAQVNG